ncbi:calmodulin-binding protein 60 B-like isoform X2 [Populus nigra]|uniref:calmodulin-binding protein 60 B-like isoform X2 n=1 Tax=Populus nigra TaxID=3691 RepID=UPI002B26E45C|nr:calmodulin-binding protein 60 B-like isoform X2 [Populus nigra]
MERSDSMEAVLAAAARGKRVLDSSSGHDEGQPDRKRPALASVIVEALKVDSLQRLCSSLEPILRRVVSEEVERALAKLGPAKLNGRSSPKQIEGPDGRNLQLHFRSRVSLPIFTGGKVEGEQGAAIHIVLIDANTGCAVTSGPESSVKLDLIVLEGDFNDEGDDNWTQEKFESHVVKEREGKRPLLTGDLQVTLKEGVGTLGELTFTDNSSWTRSRKFRLGLKVASGYCEGIRIREAKTDAITVKDHRGELYKKHYPPTLHDEVWRLEKIGKDGSFHKRLNKAGIHTVEDFLRLIVRDAQGLRTTLGSGMSNKMWDSLVEHAKTCVLSGKLYIYYPDDAKNVGVVFNNIYELSGLISNGQFYSADSLPDNQKIYVDSLVKKAYDNWIHVIEYDGNSLLDFKQHQGVAASQNDVPSGHQDFLNPYDHQDSLPTISVPVPSEQPVVHSSPAIGGSQGFCASNLNLHRGKEDFFSEEEIRTRSHDMLENEDMQQLLRIFNMGGQGLSSNSVAEDGYPYSSYMPSPSPSPSPNYSLSDNPSRSSGKAVVGWLKLKAALRWGIFVRKKAAERRAQLVELDDS